MAYISFQPSDFFNTILWAGNSSATQAVTGVGFQPDLTWIKQRNLAYSPPWTDSVRGVTKSLTSNNDSIQDTDNSNGYLSIFGADGFTVSQGSSSGDRVNGGYNYVGWNWKAGTTTGIAGSPSITPTAYSFNQTSGFSIIQYTGNNTPGATISHGLGAVPNLMIVKRTITTTGGWNVYETPYGNTQYLRLDTDASVSTATSVWNNTTPTSTLFTVGDYAGVNASGGTYIAYVFAEKKGFSKFGSYTANNSTEGPFINTGFRPAFVMMKRTVTTGKDWIIMDDKRLGYNPDNEQLRANETGIEYSNEYIDILSNGFKIKSADTDVNSPDDADYIYIAFAEFPLVSSNNIPTVAR